MRKNYILKKSLKIFIFLTIVGLSCFGFIKSSAVSSTTFPGSRYGFFTGKYSEYESAHVLNDSVTDGSGDSVPTCITTRQSLVNYIIALHNKSLTFDCNGTSQSIAYLTFSYSQRAAVRERDRIGANFIIQTMRSDGSIYDRTTPTSAEVNEWATKVLNYPGTIYWNMSKADAGITSSTINTVWASNISDITNYRDSGTTSPNGVIVFSYKGVKEYMIKRNCGNPMGFLSGLTANWSVTPSTVIRGGSSAVNTSDNITALPNKTITWTHYVKNNGPDRTDRTVSIFYDQKKYLDGQGSTASYSDPNKLLKEVSSGWGVNVTNYDTSTYITTESDIGKWICRRTISNYTSSTNAVNIGSPGVCVHVLPAPINFELKPLVEVNPDGYIEAGSSFDVTPSITNITSSTSSTVNYSLVKTITNPAGTGKTTTGSGTFVGNAETPVLKYTETTTDYSVGTNICFVLTVTPFSGASEESKSSPQVCVTIAKKPKVNVWGGDVKVGRSFFGKDFNTDAEIRTSTTTKSTTTFGSWAEYALVAPGIITGTGSGSALNGGLANVANICQYNGLSFSNAETNKSCSSSVTAKNDSIGKYNFNKTSIPDISGKFPVIKGATPELTGSVSLKDMNGLYTVNSSTNTLTILESIFTSKGKSVVINAPNANVTIVGNIELYTGADIRQISEIPQVVIIAKNIRIASGVNQIDSWLIAKSDSADVGGEINTCILTTGAIVTPSVCNNKLVINGPVMSKKLLLERTFGSDSVNGSGSAAEVINLRADAYLWAYYHAAGSGRVWTAYSTNVPPRL